MKKSIILLALLTSVLSFGQKQPIPKKIKDAFYVYFPKAQKVSWEIEDGNYEAEFTDGDFKRALLFDKNAKVLETETIIPIIELRVAAIKYVTENYKNAEITEAARIIDASGKTTFEAEVKGKDLLFNSDGELLRTEE